MAKLFGTDGIRGLVNQDLTIDLAYKIGQATAYVLSKEKLRKPLFLIGKDTRLSGEMLVNAISAGIASVGADVMVVGVLPTPAIAYLTREYLADAGVVVSASHNTMEYNGIKIFNSKGYKLKDSLEEEIERLVATNNEEIPLPFGEKIGQILRRDECVYDYIRFVEKQTAYRFEGLKVVIDCANGASYVSAPKALRELGAEVIIIHNEPDGININKNCGSTHMDDLRAYVVQVGADIGIAFDGDADRCIAVDEKGDIIDGDQILAILGIYMQEQARLNRNTIVGTVMSNLGFVLMGKDRGISIKQTKVGDRYVLERMLKDGYNLGGEQSGHIILLDENTTGDGLLTAIHLLEVLVVKGEKLSKLASVMTPLPQALVNVKADDRLKNTYMENKNILEAIKKLERKLAGQGRLLIRPSGTEALIRIMVEGRDQDEIEKEARQIADIIEKEFK